MFPFTMIFESPGHNKSVIRLVLNEPTISTIILSIITKKWIGPVLTRSPACNADIGTDPTFLIITVATDGKQVDPDGAVVVVTIKKQYCLLNITMFEKAENKLYY